MKCQILFSQKKNKKNITNLFSAEFAQRVQLVRFRKDPGLFISNNFYAEISFLHLYSQNIIHSSPQ